MAKAMKVSIGAVGKESTLPELPSGIGKRRSKNAPALEDAQPKRRLGLPTRPTALIQIEEEEEEERRQPNLEKVPWEPLSRTALIVRQNAVESIGDVIGWSETGGRSEAELKARARRREEVLRPLKVARQRAQGGIDLGAEEAENLRRRCRLHCPEFYPRPPSPANAPQPQLQ